MNEFFKSENNNHLIKFEALRKLVMPEIVSGCSSRFLVSHYLSNFNSINVFFVVDPGIKNLPMTKEVFHSIKSNERNVIVFSDFSPSPSDNEVMQGAHIYRSNSCDSIVVMGGGSAIDIAKCIGIVASNNEYIINFVGVDNIKIPSDPIICIPTTAGTSADVSQFAIVINTKTNIKQTIISKAIIPDIALIDPETTLSVPLQTTITTGLTAFVHATEAFVSNGSSKIKDILSYEAIKLIFNSLPKLVKDLNNMSLRNDIMLGTLMAGLGFSNAGLGVVHSMAHGLGNLISVNPGINASILLEHIIDYNFNFAQQKYLTLTKIFKIPFNDKASQENKKNLIINAIKKFKIDIGFNIKNLRELGLKKESILALSQIVAKDACIVTNPRPTNSKDIKRIYEQAW